MRVHLKLRNWRSVAEADVEFGPFTVIVGRNSSGKSNVVDALVFASEVASDASNAVSRRGGINSIRRYSPTKPYDITIGVKAVADGGWGRHEFVLKSGKDGAWSFSSEEVEVGGGGHSVLLRRAKDGSVRSPPEMASRFAGKLEPTTSLALMTRQLLPGRRRGRPGPPLLIHTLHPVPELMRRPQPPSNQHHLIETGENVATVLQRAKPDHRAAIVDRMRRIIPGLADIRVEPAGRYLTLLFRQEHSDGRRPEFAATEISDGALRALAVLTAAQQLGLNELLIIEEPEVNLHPGAADVVYEALHAASRQGIVLLTTHSPELLDRAQDDEILVCDYEDGVTRIGPLSSGQRAVLKNGLYTAAELMRTEDLRREGAEPALVAELA